MHESSFVPSVPHSAPEHVEFPAQHVISGAEQEALLMVQLQAVQPCFSFGGSPKSFSAISPRGHGGFAPPSGDTSTSSGPVHPAGTASTQTVPSMHGFIPEPVDELLELDELPVVLDVSPPPPDDALPLPPAPVSSNVNGAGTHALEGAANASARRLARRRAPALADGAGRSTEAFLSVLAGSAIGIVGGSFAAVEARHNIESTLTDPDFGLRRGAIYLQQNFAGPFVAARLLNAGADSVPSCAARPS